MGLRGVSRHSVRRVMVFIDGNYLRAELKNMFGNDRINYHMLGDHLRQSTRYLDAEPHLMRAYYYDANWEDEPTVPEFKEDNVSYHNQKNYLQKIEDTQLFEVRIGRLRKGKKKEQKGVDVQIAIDMISKAYEDHYDVAVLLSGDDDLLDVVKSVKNAGKNVMGAFFENSISKRLKDSFDFKHILTKDNLHNMTINLDNY